MTTQEKTRETFDAAINLLRTIHKAKRMILEETGHDATHMVVGAVLAQQIRDLVDTWPGFANRWTTPEPAIDGLDEIRRPASFQDFSETMDVEPLHADKIYMGRLCGLDIYESPKLEELAIPHHDSIARIRIAE